MKRSTSRLTTALVVTLLCFAAASTTSSGMTPAGEPDCSQWDLNGEWTLVQTNETAPVFKLQQTATRLLGEAVYYYVHEDQCFIVSCGDSYYHVIGSVDGAVVGDAFEITSFWNNGTIGVYSGRIGQQGRMEGSTYDRQHPQVTARWYSDRTVKCIANTTATGERTGTTSSALNTTPLPVAVKPQGRVRLGGVVTKSTLTKCEAAKMARARNSPAAPGLERQCVAEQASAANAVAAAGNQVRRIPPTESPVITKAEKFGAGGAAALAFAASQPENTIKVRVRYKKEFGYKGDTGAFGYIGPTSCDAFSVSVAVAEGSARQRDLIRISSDSKMADAGDYYICSWLASEISLDRPFDVSVSVSAPNLSEAWKGGSSAQPPPGQQRTVLDATRTATLSAVQPRARLSYEMVYAPVARR